MKKTVRNFVVLIVFAVAVTGLSLAQDETYAVKAQIPFNFYAGDQQLPAGTYTIGVSYASHLVTLRNHDTGLAYSALAVPANGGGSNEAMLEFHVIGGRHLLADLKTSDTGVNFAESKRLVTTAQSRTSVKILASLR